MAVAYGVVRSLFYGTIEHVYRLLVLATFKVGKTLGNQQIVEVEVRVRFMVRVKVGRVFLTWRHFVYTQ